MAFGQGEPSRRKQRVEVLNEAVGWDLLQTAAAHCLQISLPIIGLDIQPQPVEVSSFDFSRLCIDIQSARINFILPNRFSIARTRRISVSEGVNCGLSDRVVALSPHSALLDFNLECIIFEVKLIDVEHE